MMAGFGRLLTAMVSPFNNELGLDYDKAAALAEKLYKGGSDGLVVCGTTGESPTLTAEEKLKLIQVVVDAVGGKATVLAGTGSNNTAESVELTKAVQRLGVDGIMLVAPYYNKPSQEGLYQHFRTIAQSSSLPVMIYNIPGRTGVNILPETMARLAEIPNIVAIKESSGNLEQVAKLRRLLPKEFFIYSGDDSLTLPILSVGGYGVVSVASHLVGRRIKDMIEAYTQGKVAVAAQINTELLPLFKSLFITTNPVPVKLALKIVGNPVGEVRLPLVSATEEEAQAIRKTLEEMHLV
ncbi:MAG: 4-hydroxy-tetrahydrodipicolinate synthase [Firmicutes bacterium]|nr:4-hydroxy-tetrahydrodipicolinate synthase [Bacillota bacterium]